VAAASASRHELLSPVHYGPPVMKFVDRVGVSVMRSFVVPHEHPDPSNIRMCRRVRQLSAAAALPGVNGSDRAVVAIALPFVDLVWRVYVPDPCAAVRLGSLRPGSKPFSKYPWLWIPAFAGMTGESFRTIYRRYRRCCH
jgi:hypothetical protein